MRTGNPALNANTFTGVRSLTDSSNAMTLQGTVAKTGILLFLVLTTASYTWSQAFAGASVNGWMMLGGFGGFGMAIVTIFKKEWSPATAPIYALLEGLFLGGLSAFFEAMYPGIVIQAVSLTFGTLFMLLMAYTSGLIKATENFKLGIVAATGGIGMVYMASIVLGFFGIQVPFIHESGLMGIGFSMFVVVIAALNLVLDFDFIENGAEAGAPKYMEWFGAFGLMVTLIWLYLEILRLLSKLNSRD
ncbi:MAG: Bax inhibitor-1/YccA family protein [Candidatus Lindowbacteria bacterium]|nr:Bax inhibitor-1/YccA family protein [Candidatus Lindowbacteria bacterium]